MKRSVLPRGRRRDTPVPVILTLAVVAAAILTENPLVVRPAAAQSTGTLPVQANLIQNGSFETPVVPVGASVIQTTSLDRWSIAANVPGTPVRIVRAGADPAPDGAQLLELDVAASTAISQRFATIPGTIYEVTVAYAPSPGPTLDESMLQVDWNGAAIGRFFADGRRITTDWATGSMVVRATSDRAELRLFAAGSSSSPRLLIDAVAVRGALCETTQSGSWGSDSTWSCAGIHQVPGPGNDDVISHAVDTSAVNGAIAAARVSLTGQGALTGATLDIAGRLQLADQATMTRSTVTALAGVTVGGTAAISAALLTVAGDIHVTASGTLSDSVLAYQTALLGANPGLIIEQAQQAQMLNNVVEVIVQAESLLGNPTIEMQRFSNFALEVKTAPPPGDLGFSELSFAAFEAPAALSTPAPGVIVKSATPLTLTRLTIDPGLTLALAPATTVTVNGALTNNGAIVVPPTSTVILGTAAVITSGTTGTLTDSVAATVRSLQITSPVPVGGQVRASAAFTDSAIDTHYAVWNWGDGTIEQLPVDDGAGTATATHRYAASGTYTVSLVVWDAGGNASAAVRTNAAVWTSRGFYQPVSMDGVVNRVNSGSTVPLKFEVLAGTTELTDPTPGAVVTSLSVAMIPTPTATTVDAIDEVATGGTALRYDGGQFIYNWQTPKGAAGRSYQVKVLLRDGSTIQALFTLK